MRKNMGRVIWVEGTAYAKSGIESNYYVLGKWSNVQRLEENLQRGQKPNVTEFRCYAQKVRFCPVGHRKSWEVFNDRRQGG